MVLTEKLLAKLERLCKKATPGPWVWNEAQNMHGPDRWATVIETDSGMYPPRQNDRDFIAASRTAMPELIAEVRRLRAEVARQDRSMEQCTECASRERLEKAHGV